MATFKLANCKRLPEGNVTSQNQRVKKLPHKTPRGCSLRLGQVHVLGSALHGFGIERFGPSKGDVLGRTGPSRCHNEPRFDECQNHEHKHNFPDFFKDYRFYSSEEGAGYSLCTGARIGPGLRVWFGPVLHAIPKCQSLRCPKTGGPEFGEEPHRATQRMLLIHVDSPFPNKKTKKLPRFLKDPEGIVFEIRSLT